MAATTPAAASGDNAAASSSAVTVALAVDMSGCWRSVGNLAIGSVNGIDFARRCRQAERTRAVAKAAVIVAELFASNSCAAPACALFFEAQDPMTS